MQPGHYNRAATLHRLRHRFAYLPRTLRLVWCAAPAWSASWVVLLLIQGILPVATVSLTAVLVDRLVLNSGAGVARDVVLSMLIPAAGLAALLVLGAVLASVTEWVRTAQSEFVQDYIAARIHAKAIAVDLVFYETPDYYDQMERARGEASSRSLTLLENSGALIQNTITLLAMGALLLRFGFWLPLGLVVSTAPALAVIVQASRQYHSWWSRSANDRRRAAYYDLLLTSDMAAAELRLFNLGQYFQSLYQTLRQQLRTERLALLRRQSLNRLAVEALAMLITGAVLAWMGWRLLSGILSLGELVLFFQAFTIGQGLLRSLLSSAGQLYTSALYLESLFGFLDQESEIVAPSEPAAAPLAVRQAISFHDLTFGYPASDRLALDQFSLTIPAGKLVAVVGPNGAGKSTLLKLLCRFYDPQQGRVEIDGTDIRLLEPEALRRLITVMFQFPVRYHATAGQNIAIADLAGADAEAVSAAARGAGADEFIARLPQGYETMLGKWLAEGSELSGGEWQRVALARAFLRRSPIVVLDEPTSFMDSWAENEWLERFRDLVRGRTALIITHRFTTAMRADLICVMDAGRIVEQGTHAELLAYDGLYARSWKAQMRAADLFGATPELEPVSLP